MEIISVIIAGIIIGLLGKFVAPGSRDNTPIWLSFPSSEPGRQGRVRLRARRRGRAESHEERSSGIAMRLGLTLVAALSVRLCEEQLDARRVVRHLHPVIRRGGGLQRSERSRRIAARDQDRTLRLIRPSPEARRRIGGERWSAHCSTACSTSPARSG